MCACNRLLRVAAQRRRRARPILVRWHLVRHANKVLLDSALPTDRAADQHASLTIVRDTSNIQSRSVGKTRLTTRLSRTARQASRTPGLAHTRPRAPRPQPRAHQASRTPGLAHPGPSLAHPPHPQLPKNVARNSPTAISTFESTPLKFRGFQRTPKLTTLELRAKSLSYPQISQTTCMNCHKDAQYVHGPQ